ncbi:hypothetical protein BDV10DRAFT_179239 [Aspergillus recurvatus]
MLSPRQQKHTMANYLLIRKMSAQSWILFAIQLQTLIPIIGNMDEFAGSRKRGQYN